MARLFVSHSSRDNVAALAFQNWLSDNGWDRDDVFIDLDDIGAGQRWRDTLHKANAACEAVIFLASPNSLRSVECQKELEFAEALGKELIVAILRDLHFSDPGLARYSDRQLVNLSTYPQDHVETLNRDGVEHRIEFNRDALERIKARLNELGIAPGSFAWPPKGVIDPGPYPGLSAFTEDEAGIFFGRDADILKALTQIRLVRKRKSPRIIVIDAASGAGKSSFLRAGLWPRLKRDPDFAPLSILRPARGILSGPDGLGQGLSKWFERFGQSRPAGSIQAQLLKQDKQEAVDAFTSLFSDVVWLANKTRQVTAPEARQPAPLLAIDQAEELFAAEDDVESRQFLHLLAALIKSPPPGLDPYVILTIRADSVQSLLTRFTDLGLGAPEPLYLLPLSPLAYREVILKPAELYNDRVRRLTVDPALVNAIASSASGADALPLLAFTLSRMFADYRPDGQLTLVRYEESGGIGGSVSRALRQAQARAGATGTDAHLRRLLVPRLTTWDNKADGGRGAAKRLVGNVQDVLGGPRAELSLLANELVNVRLLSRGRETLEVAHEALLRLPPLSDWLMDDREFLVWRDSVGKARAAYEANIRGLLVGRELQIARDWLSRRTDLDDIPALDRAFVVASSAEEERNRREDQERERKRQEAELEAAKAREQIAIQAAEAALQAAHAREQSAALEARAAAERQRAAELEAKAAEEREVVAKEREVAAQIMAAAARRTAQRTVVGLIASLMLATLAGAIGYIAYDRKLAAEAARREALLTQSKFLADSADREASAGNAGTALLLALEALPDDPAMQSREFWAPAEYSLGAARQELRERAVLAGHGGSVYSVAMSLDGTRIFTGSFDNTARVWDAASGGQLVKLEGHKGAVSSVAVSPDGTRIVTGSFDKTARVWDVASGRELMLLVGHSGAVSSVAVSPDGTRIVTGSDDKTARVWDAATGHELVKLVGHENSVSSVTVSQDGTRIITGSFDSTARVWDVSSGHEIIKLTGHGDGVSSVAMSPDGTRIVTGSFDHTARVWNATTGRELVKLTGHGGRIHSVAISPDSTRIVTCSDDGTARFWAAASGRELTKLAGHGGGIFSVAVSADGTNIVTGSFDSTARLWNAVGGREDIQLAGHEGAVYGVAVSSDGTRIVTGSDDNTARIWDASNGRELLKFIGHEDFVSSVAVSEDGTRIVTGSGDKTARVWDAVHGRELAKFIGHAGPVSSVAISQDGTRIVSGSHDKTARVWASANGRELVKFIGHQGAVTSVAISQDGTRIVTGSEDKTARIWDAVSGRERVRLIGHENGVSSVAMSPDGTRVVTGSDDKTARVWDANTGRELLKLSGHSGLVYSAAMSLDGTRIVTGSFDNTARVWDAVSGREIVKLTGHSGSIYSIAISRDDARIITGSGDNTARTWKMPYAGFSLYQEAKAAAPRCLTPSERKKFFLSDAPPLWCTGLNKWPFDPVGGPVAISDLVSNGDEDEAKVLYDALLNSGRASKQVVSGGWARGLMARAVKALESQRDEEADQLLQKARLLDSSLAPEIDKLWSRTWAARGVNALEFNNDEAMALFEKAKHLDASVVPAVDKALAQSAVRRGVLALETAKLGEAQGDFEYALKLDADVIEDIAAAIATRATELIDATEVDRSLEFSERSVAWAQSFGQQTVLAKAKLARGKAFEAMKRYEEALVDFTEALKLGDREAASWIHWSTSRLGESMVQQGRLTEGVLVLFDNMIQLNPEIRSQLGQSALQSNTIGYNAAGVLVRQSQSAQMVSTPCDRLAGHPADPLGSGDSIELDRIEPTAAIAACNEAAAQQPGEVRFIYQRGRAHSRAAQIATSNNDEATARIEYERAVEDFEAAMTKGYPFAFNNMAAAYGNGQGKDNDSEKAASLYVEAHNRVLTCCWVRAAQLLLADRDKLDHKRLRRVLGEVTLWSAALGSEEAKALLAELTASGTIEALPPPPPANISDLPPWYRADWTGETGKMHGN